MNANVPLGVIEIKNQLNLFKFFLLLMEPCTSTLLNVYLWLYAWPNSVPEDLADHLQEVPHYEKHNKTLKSKFNKNELDEIKSMQIDRCRLRKQDITFYYRVSNDQV